MSTTPPNPLHVKAWQAAIETIAPVNGPLDVVPLNEQGKPMPRARGRLLAVDPSTGVLTVEKMANQQSAEALRKGTTVEVFVVVGQSRIKASSRVIAVGLFQLNPQTRVMAVQLEPVRDITPAQRRRSFRLSTKALLMPTARLTRGTSGRGSSTFEAILLDLSERGANVLVRMELAVARSLQGQRLKLHVELPEVAEPLELDTRVMRVYDQSVGNPTLGLHFEFSSVTEQRRVEKVILHFSAEQQRKQLRRAKRVG